MLLMGPSEAMKVLRSEPSWEGTMSSPSESKSTFGGFSSWGEWLSILGGG